MQNLREAVHKQLALDWKELRKSHQKLEELPLEEISPLEVEQWLPHPEPKREMVRVARQAERAEWYEQVVALHARGFTNKAIAERLKRSRANRSQVARSGNADIQSTPTEKTEPF
jgi:DNA-binding NarL/FixJ family response regulator